MMKIFLPVLLLMTLITSCSRPAAKFVATNFEKPQRIAVLPTINQTDDVNGALIFRDIFYSELLRKDYAEVLDVVIVDSLLNEAGITAGGQLETIDNQELFELLKVDGLFYIELLTCGIEIGDHDAVGRARANLKLYVPPGKLIWEDEREEITQSSRGSGSGDLAEALVGGLLIESVGKTIIKGTVMSLFETECKMEMITLIQNSLKTLP
jgi:hypothetical protein